VPVVGHDVALLLRERAVQSNTGYVVLGALIEAISGLSNVSSGAGEVVGARDKLSRRLVP